VLYRSAGVRRLRVGLERRLSAESTSVSVWPFSALTQRGFCVYPALPSSSTLQRQQTPLMLSVTNVNAIRVTELLIESGADIDAATADLQMTALLFACKDNNVPAIKLLLQVGANPCITDVSRRTCFHYAVLSCPPALVRELNERTKGAFLNAADSSGYTPLMLAAEHGRADTARDLLEMGANPLLRNKLNHQAIELADWFGQKRIVEELEAWFKRSGVSMRGERVEGADGEAAARGVAVPPSPAAMGTPLPGMMSPGLAAATPGGGQAAHAGGEHASHGGAPGMFGSSQETARDVHAAAPDPVGQSLAQSGSTVPFS
jgi:Ankyrin repeats (3 copies)/Ankyrin repeat